jgi:hypothetical protein
MVTNAFLNRTIELDWSVPCSEHPPIKRRPRHRQYLGLRRFRMQGVEQIVEALATDYRRCIHATIS